MDRGPGVLVFRSAKAGRTGRGVSDRLWRYFVEGGEDGAFLRYSTVVAEAPNDLTAEQVEAADYLDTNLNIPIFSAAFVAATREHLAEDLEFYPCVVRCAGRDLDTFHMGRVKKYLPLVDRARSTYRMLPAGGRLLRRPAYDPRLADRFMIARDDEHRAGVVCAPRLVELVQRAGLRVNFVPAS